MTLRSSTGLDIKILDSSIVDWLAKSLRYFNPAAIDVGTTADFYDSVVSDLSLRLSSATTVTTNSFYTTLDKSMSEYYSKNWHQNSSVGKREFASVIFERLLLWGQEMPNLNDGPWLDMANTSVVTWTSTDIYDGTTRYELGDDENERLLFQYSSSKFKPSRGLNVQLGIYFGLVVDRFGRLMCPAHFLDNLVLQSRASADIIFPANTHKGRVYLIGPSRLYEGNEIKYLSAPMLEVIRFDKDARILEFGDKIGSENVEVASGFVVSIESGSIVHAWVRLK